MFCFSLLFCFVWLALPEAFAHSGSRSGGRLAKRESFEKMLHLLHSVSFVTRSRGETSILIIFKILMLKGLLVFFFMELKFDVNI